MYGSVCHILPFCVLYLFYYVFRLKTSPPNGAVSVVTFHPVYLSFPRLTPRLADGPREVFLHDFSIMLAPVFPSISTRDRFPIVPYLWLVCRRAFPAPSRHTGDMRQVLEPFLPPPATPAACGRFLMGDFYLVVRSAFLSTAFLRVFLAS